MLVVLRIFQNQNLANINTHNIYTIGDLNPSEKKYLTRGGGGPQGGGGGGRDLTKKSKRRERKGENKGCKK
jgi:hypothetical protein